MHLSYVAWVYGSIYRYIMCIQPNVVFNILHVIFCGKKESLSTLFAYMHHVTGPLLITATILILPT